MKGLNKNTKLPYLKKKCDQLMFNLFRRKNNSRFELSFQKPNHKFTKIKKIQKESIFGTKKLLILSNKINIKREQIYEFKQNSLFELITY